MQFYDPLVAVNLKLFRAKLEVVPAPRSLFLAAGKIAWIATFAPWAVSREQRHRLRDDLLEYRSRSDYSTNMWWRTPLLSAAALALDSDEIGDHDFVVEPLDLIDNLDHHNSSLRCSIVEALSFVGPRLAWNTPAGDEMVRRAESCVTKSYVHADWAVVLVLSMNGERDSKRSWVADLLSLDVAPQHRPMLEELLTRGTCENPAAGWMLEIASHTAASLLHPDAIHHAPTQPTPADVVSELDQGRVDQHPLMHQWFTIPDLKP